MYIVVCEIHGQVYSNSNENKAYRAADMHAVQPGHYGKWVKVIRSFLVSPPSSEKNKETDKVTQELVVYTIIGSNKD